jgi:hypothetical protein
MLSRIWVYPDGSEPHNWTLLKGSHCVVLSLIRVEPYLHCASLLGRIPPWTIQSVSILPAIVYTCRENHPHNPNVEHWYRTEPSRSLHCNMTPFVWNVRSLANSHNPELCGLMGNSQHPATMTPISVPPGERYSTQGGSSVAWTIQLRNITHASSPNISYVRYITQWVS